MPMPSQPSRGTTARSARGPAHAGTARSRGERTHDALLAAARIIAAEQGWHAVTVRRVAEAAQCSPALVYEYFASKEALLLELVRDGFHRLRARIAAAGAAARGDTAPASAMRAMALAYVAFAREDGDLYQVMYGLGGTRFPAGDTWDEGTAVGALFLPVVAALAAPAPGTTATRPARAQRPRLPRGMRSVEEGRVHLLWATVHGVVALVLAGRIAGGWPAAEALVADAVGDLLVAWQHIP